MGAFQRNIFVVTYLAGNIEIGFILEGHFERTSVVLNEKEVDRLLLLHESWWMSVLGRGGAVKPVGTGRADVSDEAY